METLRTLRSPAFVLPFLILPAGLYLFYALVLLPPDVPAPILLKLYVAFGVFAVMGPALFGFGLSVSLDRTQGLLTLRRALPAPPGSYLVAKMAMSLVFALLAMAPLAAAAAWTLGAQTPLDRLLIVAAVEVAGALPFSAIGFLVGAYVGARTAPAVVNLLYLPMLYLGGVFFPLPGAFKPWEVLSPAHYLSQLGQWAAGLPSEGEPAVHAAVLAGVAIVFTALAERGLTRQPGTRRSRSAKA